jgi:hypothetical protein
MLPDRHRFGKFAAVRQIPGARSAGLHYETDNDPRNQGRRHDVEHCTPRLCPWSLLRRVSDVRLDHRSLLTPLTGRHQADGHPQHRHP